MKIDTRLLFRKHGSDSASFKVMSKQLLLLHNGVSAYFAGNQQALAGAVQEFSAHLQVPSLSCIHFYVSITFRVFSGNKRLFQIELG